MTTKTKIIIVAYFVYILFVFTGSDFDGDKFINILTTTLTVI